jgi:hypothetical protein
MRTRSTFALTLICSALMLFACIVASRAAQYLPDYPVQSVFDGGANGPRLAGTDGGNGIYRWDGVTFEEYGGNLDRRDVLAIVQRHTDRMVFVGTWGKGVYRRALGMDAWERFSQGIDSDYAYIRAMAQDPQDGTLYAVDPRRRVYRLSPSKQAWQSIPSTGLPGAEARSLFVDQGGRLHIGLVESGVYFYDPGRGRWTLKGDLGGQTVYAMDAGPDGKLWVGTSSAGVFRWDGTGWDSISDAWQVTALKANPPHQEVVVGTASGQVFKHREADSPWSPVDVGVPSGTWIWALAFGADEPQTLLVGTDKGLYTTQLTRPTPTPTSTPVPPEKAMIVSLRHSESADGHKLSYIISYRNRYAGIARDVVITNSVPLRVTLVPGSYGDGVKDSIDGATVLKWQLGEIGAGCHGAVGYQVSLAQVSLAGQPPATIPPPTPTPQPTATILPPTPQPVQNDGAYIQWTIGGVRYPGKSNADVFPSHEALLPVIMH